MATKRISRARAQALRRRALDIAVQLPEDADEALAVLCHAQWLVTRYLARESDGRAVRGEVINWPYPREPSDSGPRGA